MHCYRRIGSSQALPREAPRRRPGHPRWPSSTSRCESRNAPSGARSSPSVQHDQREPGQEAGRHRCLHHRIRTVSRRSLSENCSGSGMAPNSSVTVFPRRRHWSMRAPRPATANCQEIVAGVERRAECYDRDAGDCQGCWRMLPRRLCGRPRPGRTTATKTALVKVGANRPDVPGSRLRR